MVTSSNGSRRWLSRAASRRARAPSAGASRFVVALALVIASLAAVGCSSTSPNSGVDKFVGSWTFDSGTVGGTCLGQTLANDLTAQTFALARGTSSDLVSTLGTCVMTLSVDGARASADPTGQMCTFTFPFRGQPVTANVRITAWTNDSADGRHLTTTAAGTGSGGLVDGCPFMLAGAATKSAGPTDASAG